MQIDLNNLLKQTQDMQTQMQSIQEDLSKIRVVGEAGAGLVKVEMDGRHVVIDVQVDPKLLTDPQLCNEEGAPVLLQELLIAAVNDAREKAEVETREKLTKLYATQIQTKFEEIEAGS